jgi:dTDP-4-amino-4,6-dideoxygalactose transaminase
MSWFVYVVRIAPEIGRDSVMAALQDAHIPSRPYFTPIHLQPFYMKKFGYNRGDFPITEEAGDTCLALPFSAIMREEQVHYVCEALTAILA